MKNNLFGFIALPCFTLAMAESSLHPRHSKRNNSNLLILPLPISTMVAGHCFNPVLVQDSKTMSNPGCVSLILRETEWAATDDVK